MPKNNARRPAGAGNAPQMEGNDAARMQQTSLAAINKLITGISKAAVKLNESIHNAATMCMKHAYDFGDCSPAARLIDALPKSHRRSLVIGWFSTFSPITIGKDSKTDKMKAHLAGKADANKGEAGYRDWQLEAAKQTPFYAMPEAEREPEVPSYDNIHKNVVDFLGRMFKRAEKIENADDRMKAEVELRAAKEAVEGRKAA